MKPKFIIICLSLISIFACGRRKEKTDGEAYNPYDTSEQMNAIDSTYDAIYTLDSLELVKRERKN